MKVVLMATSLIQTRFDVGTESAEKYAGKKVRLDRVSNSQPPGHESVTLNEYITTAFEHKIVLS